MISKGCTIILRTISSIHIHIQKEKEREKEKEALKWSNKSILLAKKAERTNKRSKHEMGQIKN